MKNIKVRQFVKPAIEHRAPNRKAGINGMSKEERL